MLKQGFAKTGFAEIYQRTPWTVLDQDSQNHSWPLVDQLFEQKRLTYLDYILTHRLLRHHSTIAQETALFLCHLTLAAKEGHLCVRMTEQSFNPSVNQLWQNDEGSFLKLEDEKMLTELMLAGASQIPEGLITTLKKEGAFTPHTPICREGNDFYLQRHWVFETLFLKYFKQHIQQTPTISLEKETVENTLSALCQAGVLLEEQAAAILKGCLNTLTIITGGPGTGKTYTAGHFIKVFWQHLSDEQKQSYEIVLAAPTGKAAANLQRSLNKVAAEIKELPLIQAKTLHSLLEMRKQSHFHENVRLTADLIIIDESSMIDVKMMAYLFESLKPGSRLILLGDPDQLPSVEAGSLFADLIQLPKNYPDLDLSCVSLSICLRAELKSLIDFAQLIKKGKAQEVLTILNQGCYGGVKRLHLATDKKDAQKELIDHILPYFPSILKLKQKPEHLLELFQSIRLLSPIRKGPFGVESLNQMIWQKICSQLPSYGYLAIPIMITANDYQQELFNGETGVLIRRLPIQSIGLEDYAVFMSKQENGQARNISALLLPKYELAYCLSVHKSQGSEFNQVILVLPEGAELFGREIFYTAVTRARQSIEIYGSDAVILKTIQQQGLRLSGINHRLKL